MNKLIVLALIFGVSSAHAWSPYDERAMTRNEFNYEMDKQEHEARRRESSEKLNEFNPVIFYE